MKALFENKSINNVAVGFIIGFGVVNFVTTVGGALVGDLLSTSSSYAWSWSAFWHSLIVLVLVLLAGWVVNSQAE